MCIFTYKKKGGGRIEKIEENKNELSLQICEEQ